MHLLCTFFLIRFSLYYCIVEVTITLDFILGSLRSLLKYDAFFHPRGEENYCFLSIPYIPGLGQVFISIPCKVCGIEEEAG